jgi:hypothetical protein
MTSTRRLTIYFRFAQSLDKLVSSHMESRRTVRTNRWRSGIGYSGF